jgi:CRISPR-associated protein Csd1
VILRRLYELAEWAELLADPSVEPTPVACVIKVGRSGDFNGLIDLREDEQGSPAVGKRSAKVVKTAGLTLPVPLRAVIRDARAPAGWKVTDPAGNGKERPSAFLCDTLARVLPVDGLIAAQAVKKKLNPEGEQAKNRAQRSTFWRFIRYAAGETKHPTLTALATFGERMLDPDPATVARIEAAVTASGLGLSDLCTLESTADDGPVLTNPDVMRWWRDFYVADAAAQQADLPCGVCQVIQRMAPLERSVKVRVNGLTPIGCRADAYLVVGLEVADSYGFEGAQAGMVSAAGIDGFTRAIHALLDDRLPSRRDKSRSGGIRSSMRVGKTQLLFWTRDMESGSGFEILDASPDQFAGLLDTLRKGAAVTTTTGVEPDQFRVLALSGNAARVVVRDYLERPLPDVQRNLLRWFDDLRIADPSKEFGGRPNDRFPLWLLAAATARDADGVAPDAQARLMHAALTAGPLPDSVLAACLGRLRAEGSDGFRPARMGLIKLCLNRAHCQENPVTESLDPARGQSDKAYACGQLLAFLARCQSPQDFGTSAQILERFFGTASTSPRGVFPTLLRLNRHHIAKIRDEMPGFAFNLEAELEERLLPFKPAGGGTADFPSLLSLPEQGRFALGFYHQRAEYRRQSSDKKMARSADQPAAPSA